jgi:hypothetical protein
MTDLSITASQVQPGTTDAAFEYGTAGATITAGQAVYLDATTNKYKLADCDLSAAAATVRGIALNGAADGQPIKVQTGGTITLGAGAAPAVGTVYVLSSTAGGIAPAADLATGKRTSIIGVGAATNTLLIKINNSGQVVP